MNWVERFPGLSTLESDIKARLLAGSRIVAMPKGAVIFGPGKAPENLLLLLDGVVRVQQTSESGREIVLYRVAAGESCVLTTACLLAYEDYQAEGMAETNVSAVAIPRRTFDLLIAESEAFRRFVFSAYSRRITDLFTVIEEVAFQRMDIRLAQKLLALSEEGCVIKITHQKMAAELGSAREVVSRLLQEFQRQGAVEVARGEIRIRDRAALRALAENV